MKIRFQETKSFIPPGASSFAIWPLPRSSVHWAIHSQHSTENSIHSVSAWWVYLWSLWLIRQQQNKNKNNQYTTTIVHNNHIGITNPELSSSVSGVGVVVVLLIGIGLIVVDWEIVWRLTIKWKGQCQLSKRIYKCILSVNIWTHNYF